MRHVTIAFTMFCLATPAFAEANKQEICGYQGEMTSMIQKARLDGVAEKDVTDTLLAAKPDWPENFNKAIPPLAQWVYQTDLGLIEQTDLGAVWESECLKNWDVIKMNIGN